MRRLLTALILTTGLLSSPMAWSQAPTPIPAAAASEAVAAGDSMLTLDSIRTFAGQTLAIMVMTQAARYVLPTLAGTGVMGVAFLVGVGLQLVFVAYGGTPAAYVLAVLNGFLVATAAMKTAEIVRGTAPEAVPKK